MTTSIQNALDDKIRKLQQLRDLLSDPEIAKIARSILSRRDASGTAVDAVMAAISPARAPANVRRKRKKKRGILVKKVFEMVRDSTVPLTAKEVALALDRDGFDFKAEDKIVSVSKALRSLAAKQKINHKRGQHAKAAISYSRLPSLVPVVTVQEMRH
jgi:hypothetical protein